MNEMKNLIGTKGKSPIDEIWIYYDLIVNMSTISTPVKEWIGLISILLE